MGIEKTDVTMFSKVQSLGARFFEKFVSTKAMNKKITEMNNIGLRDVIICTTASQTTDFGSLKVGDKVVMIPASAGNSVFVTCTVAGDLGIVGIPGNLYLVITPSM